MIIAFTGPSDLDADQRVHVASYLGSEVLRSGDTWRSGCAFHTDSIVAYFARMMEFDIQLELFVPFANHNGTMVNELGKHARVCRLAPIPGGAAEQYRQRNFWMVNGSRALFQPSNQLVAFVKSKKFYRSGEWMTINLARNAGIPVTMEEL